MMNPELSNFIIGILRAVTICDLAAAAIGAASLWRMRKGIPLARYTGILLSAIAFDQSCQLIAGLHRPQGIIYGTWFLGWWLTGRLMRISATMALVLYILGFGRGRQE